MKQRTNKNGRQEMEQNTEDIYEGHKGKGFYLFQMTLYDPIPFLTLPWVYDISYKLLEMTK